MSLLLCKEKEANAHIWAQFHEGPRACSSRLWAPSPIWSFCSFLLEGQLVDNAGSSSGHVHPGSHQSKWEWQGPEASRRATPQL